MTCESAQMDLLIAKQLTIIGSCDLETQQVISLSVSFLTTLMEAISGCLVASSPVACVCVWCDGGGMHYVYETMHRQVSTDK